MAKLEYRLSGNFDRILADLENTVLQGASSSKEGASNFWGDDCRCAVRVYERYSFIGSNRVSMSITLFEAGDEINLSVITSGGSQAVFMKMNTFGEENFLAVIRRTAEKYRIN